MYDRPPKDFNELIPELFEILEEDPDRIMQMYMSDKKVIIMSEDCYEEIIARLCNLNEGDTRTVH